MDPDDLTTAPTVSRLPLVAMGALVVLAIFVAVALGLRGPAEFADGTPEAAVQDYLQAVLDGDADAVRATLTAEQRVECGDEFSQYSTNRMTGIGFELDEIEITGDMARAELTLRRTTSGDPFQSTSRFGEHFVELRLEGDDWNVARASWPWRLENCLRSR